MTLEELKTKLYNHNVPERWYSLDDGLKPDTFILLKNYNKWEYFYLSEKGDREDFRVFYSENEAYEYLWKELEYNLRIFKIKPRVNS